MTFKTNKQKEKSVKILTGNISTWRRKKFNVMLSSKNLEYKTFECTLNAK